VKVLLDTNAALWLAEDPALVDASTVELLREDRVELLLSTVVPWEVAVKFRAGKLELPGPPREWAERAVREFGAAVLPVRLEHAVRVADLPDHHRDPFDRLLIAQAQVEGVPIVTADDVFARYDVEVIPAR
jgi:PIN domain nuclease of toxin-antitoxin system